VCNEKYTDGRVEKILGKEWYIDPGDTPDTASAAIRVGVGR